MRMRRRAREQEKQCVRDRERESMRVGWRQREKESEQERERANARERNRECMHGCACMYTAVFLEIGMHTLEIEIVYRFKPSPKNSSGRHRHTMGWLRLVGSIKS